MATTFTKLYLLNVAAPYTPATFRGAWDDTAGGVTKSLSPSKAGGGLVTIVSQGETSADITSDVLLYRGVSGPLAAQTISGTLNVLLGVVENGSQGGDDCYHVHVYVTQGDSDTPRGTLLTDYVETTANEWGGAAASCGRAFLSAQSLSSLAISAGDRLVVEIGYIARNSSTSVWTGNIYCGTLLADASLASDMTAGGNATSQAGYLVFSSAIEQQDTQVNVTQSVAEVATQGTVSSRVSHLATEVLTQPTVPGRVTQLGVEVLTGALSPGRVTQLAVEVLVSAAVTASNQNAIWMGDGGSAIWVE